MESDIFFYPNTNATFDMFLKLFLDKKRFLAILNFIPVAYAMIYKKGNDNYN